MAYPPYIVTDWYWKVGDTNPTTHRFSSASGTYVVLADATYAAWVAAGNTATTIDTEANLYVEINRAALNNLPKLWGVNITTMAAAGTVTLTNPMVLSQFIDITGLAGTYILKLPPMNTPNSVPIGVPFIIRSEPTSTFAATFLVKDNAGTTLATLATGEEWQFRLKTNTTAAGTFDDVLLRQIPLTFPHGGTGLASASVAAVLITPDIIGGSSCSSVVLGTAQLLVGQTAAAPLPKTVSGDLTFAASGAATIANDAVTYAKMQNVSATNKLLGRTTAGAGDVEEIALPLSVANGGTGGTGAAWTTYTPAVAARTGALTSYTVNSASYEQIGKTVRGHFDVTITDAGTGGQQLLVALPVTARSQFQVCFGEDFATAKSAGGTISTAGGGDYTKAAFLYYDGTGLIATGTQLVCNFQYEAA